MGTNRQHTCVLIVQITEEKWSGINRLCICLLIVQITEEFSPKETPVHLLTLTRGGSIVPSTFWWNEGLKSRPFFKFSVRSGLASRKYTCVAGGKRKPSLRAVIAIYNLLVWLKKTISPKSTKRIQWRISLTLLCRKEGGYAVSLWSFDRHACVAMQALKTSTSKYYGGDNGDWTN